MSNTYNEKSFTEEALKELYVVKKLPAYIIARKLNCAIFTVRKWTQKYKMRRKRVFTYKNFNTTSGYLANGSSGKIEYVHRIIMEKSLGRKLKKNEYVHHINGNKKDNRLCNLKLLTSTQHGEHHHPEDKKPTLVCKFCKNKFRPKRKKNSTTKTIGISQWMGYECCSQSCKMYLYHQRAGHKLNV